MLSSGFWTHINLLEHVPLCHQAFELLPASVPPQLGLQYFWQYLVAMMIREAVLSLALMPNIVFVNRSTIVLEIVSHHDLASPRILQNSFATK